MPLREEVVLVEAIRVISYQTPLRFSSYFLTAKPFGHPPLP